LAGVQLGRVPLTKLLNAPTSHSWHVLDPVWSVNDPAAHGAHEADALECANVPAAQSVQAAESALLNDPASQIEHVVAAVRLLA